MLPEFAEPPDGAGLLSDDCLLRRVRLAAGPTTVVLSSTAHTPSV